MTKHAGRGFTLIEVVLAIAVGLIIIAGVSVGYAYAKRAAVTDNARKTVGLIKAYVESSIAAQQALLGTGTTGCNDGNQAPVCPPLLTLTQMQSLASTVPSVGASALTGLCYNLKGTDNRTGNANNCPGATGGFFKDRTGFTCGMSANDPVWSNDSQHWGNDSINYLSGGGNGGGTTTFVIPLADGSTRTFFDYAIVLSDENGNAIAADGGTQESFPNNFGC